jgi:hypothetical protein
MAKLLSGTRIYGNATIDSNLIVGGNVIAQYLFGNGSALSGIVTSAFGNIFIAGQSPVLADNTSDTLTLVSGSGIAITANASSDTITIATVSTEGPFATSGDFGAVNDPVTVSEDEGSVADGETITYDLGSLISATGLIYPDQLVLPNYSTASLPSATVAGQLVYDTTTQSLAYTDGTIWNSLVGGYSNVQVASYLPIYSGNIANIRLGVSGALTFSDGTAMTTAAASYSNVQVATYLPTYTGTVSASLINSSGNILATGLSVFGNTRIGSLATPGAEHTIIGNVSVSGAGTEYFNIAGNILAVQGSFGSVNSTGFINTSGNVSAAVYTGGAVSVTGFINTSGNISSGGNVTVANLIVSTGAGQFNGPFNESTTIQGVYVGNLNLSPRIGFFNGTAAQNWQIDNNFGSFRWYTPGVTRMTIDTGGNLNVPSGNIMTAGNVTAPYFIGSGQFLTGLPAGYSNATAFSYLSVSNISISSLGVGTAASGNVGEIRATNAITSFYSDRRLKTNFKQIENALDKVNRLQGILYTQNELAETFGYNDYSRQVGVFAQDVQIVQPEAVKPAPFDISADGSSISGEHYLTVQYDKLVPLLIEAIKELTEQVNILKDKK